MKKIVSIAVIFSLLFSGIMTVNFVSARTIYSTSNDSEDYAVIMVGRYFPRFYDSPALWGRNGNWTNMQVVQTYYNWYLKDAARMYNTLKKYGYDDDHIFLLVKTLPSSITVKLNYTDENGEAVKKTFFKMPDEFNPNLIDTEYTPDEAGFKKLLDTFKPGHKNALSEDDSLYICFIDHGGTENYEDGTNSTYFGLPLDSFLDYINYATFLFNLIDSSDISFGSNIIGTIQDILELLGLSKQPETLFDWEMANYINGIRGKFIFVLQPCHSGGFIEELSGENRIICTSARPRQIAGYGWIGQFRAALENNGVNADYNNDGNISIREAYEHANSIIQERYNRDTDPNKKPQHPLIDDNGDGIGSHFDESGYDPENPESDGYLANHTYLQGTSSGKNKQKSNNFRNCFKNIDISKNKILEKLFLKLLFLKNLL